MSIRAPILPPGFRFHPTDEELIVHYLMNQAASMACPVPIIAEVDIYKCDPWDLPGKALFGEKEWYFFSPRDRKYPNGVRPNRAAGSGYWKATGTDKMILSTPGNENIGVKKALVFYRGKPPKGVKTDWIMHEYRLTETNKSSRRRGSSMRLDDWVLCRIYKKSNDFQITDQEQEDLSSTVDDSLNMASSPKPDPLVHLTKSCSLTDLLNAMDYSALAQLLDGSAEVAEPSQSPLNYKTNPYQTLNYNNVNSYMSQEPCLDHNNGMKRKRVVDGTSSLEDGSDGLHAAKRLQAVPSDSRGSSATTSYCNQFESFQYNLLNQPFLNQQLLLNNFLELQ